MKYELQGCCYISEGYLFSLSDEQYFGSVITRLGEASTIKEAINNILNFKVDGKSVCKIYKLSNAITDEQEKL